MTLPLSPRTGFIHLHYTAEEARDTIPLYENACYILSLFRSHTAENAAAARDLLTRLLSYQTEEGGFPTYLHELPVARHRVSFHMLLPFLWMEKLYGKYLDRRALSCSIFQLIHYCSSKQVPSFLRWKLDVALRLKEGAPLVAPDSKDPEELGHMLFAAELAGDPSLWERLLQKALRYWNQELFLSEGTLQAYRGESVEPTTLDVYLSSLYQIFPGHHVEAHYNKLQSSLCFLRKKHLSCPSGEVSRYERDFSPSDCQRPPAWHLLRTTWGDRERLFSLACQESRHAYAAGCFTLAEHDDLELFFSAVIDWKVEGKKATIFSLEDKITLEAGGKCFTLIFSLEKGKGNFVGKIYKGTRPSQMRKDPFSAHDWVIKMQRTRRGTEEDVVRLLIYEDEEVASSSLGESAGLSTATPIA